MILLPKVPKVLHIWTNTWFNAGISTIWAELGAFHDLYGEYPVAITVSMRSFAQDHEFTKSLIAQLRGHGIEVWPRMSFGSGYRFEDITGNWDHENRVAEFFKEAITDIPIFRAPKSAPDMAFNANRIVIGKYLDLILSELDGHRKIFLDFLMRDKVANYDTGQEFNCGPLRNLQRNVQGGLAMNGVSMAVNGAPGLRNNSYASVEFVEAAGGTFKERGIGAAIDYQESALAGRAQWFDTMNNPHRAIYLAQHTPHGHLCVRHNQMEEVAAILQEQGASE